MKALRIYTIATFAAVALAAAGCTQTAANSPEDDLAADPEAAEVARGPAAMFAQADKDKDGRLTLDEARAIEKEHFAKIDKNGDGQLDTEELAAGRPLKGGRGPGAGGQGRMGQGPCANADDPAACQARGPRGGDGKGPEHALARLDKDGNGSISKEEAPPRMQQRFAEVDTNSDGALDQAELENWHKSHGPGERGKDGMGKGQRDGEGKGPGRRMPNLDKDGNGTVSAQEFEQGARERFERRDANKDGVVTKDELPQGRGARKAF